MSRCFIHIRCSAIFAAVLYTRHAIYNTIVFLRLFACIISHGSSLLSKLSCPTPLPLLAEVHLKSISIGQYH